MSGTGVKRSRTVAEPEILAPAIVDERGVEHFHEYQAQRLRLVWHLRWIPLRALAIGLALSTLAAVLTPNQYTSTARIMPPDPQSATEMAMMTMAMKAGGAFGGMAGDLLGIKTPSGLFLGVLRSETLQNRLVREFDLRKVYKKKLEEDAREKLDEHTWLLEDRNTGIISVSVTEKSPELAAHLANAYVSGLNELLSSLSTSAAHRERVFLEDRIKVVKQNLDVATEQLAEFSSKNHAIDVQQEGKVMLEASANLAGQMIAAQAELEGVRQVYTDNNPRVRALNARVAELRKELDKLGGTKTELGEKAGAGEQGSSGAPASLSLGSLPLVGVKYGDFYRQAKMQETVYELLTEQYEMAKVQEAKETLSVRVLDPASVRERRSAPHRLLMISLGTLLALGVATVWMFAALFWHEFDSRDPRKIFVREVLNGMSARLPWIGNGEASRRT